MIVKRKQNAVRKPKNPQEGEEGGPSIAQAPTEEVLVSSEKQMQHHLIQTTNGKPFEETTTQNLHLQHPKDVDVVLYKRKNQNKNHKQRQHLDIEVRVSLLKSLKMK